MSDMAEVLAQHKYDQEGAVCSCSDFVQVGLRCDAQTHPEHLAEVLIAAGFGPVQAARAEALEQAADHIMGPSENLRDAATCRDIAQELRAHAAAERGEG